MKISFFETSKLEKERFEKELQNQDLQFFDKPIQEVEPSKLKNCEVICIFVHSEINENTISQMPNLKLICTRSTGIDHIDTKICNEKNIKIKNVPLYGENTVAEHTFALILSLSRKIHTSYVRSIQGKFSTLGLQGFDLQDKTIGIIGGRKNRATRRKNC